MEGKLESIIRHHVDTHHFDESKQFEASYPRLPVIIG